MIRVVRKYIRTASFLAVAVFAATSLPAWAEKIDADTPLLVIGSEVMPFSKVLQRGDIIVSSRIVYARLAIADEDIYGSDGKVVGASSKRLLLTKGAQMFGVVTNNGQITYCAVDHKAVGALEGVFVINRDKHSCFIDRDRDGRFDASYDLRTKFSSLPIYYDVEVTGNALSMPVSYTSIDPLELKLPIALEVELYQIKAHTSRSEVKVRLNSEGNIDYLKGTLSRDATTESSPIEMFGAEFTLSRKDDKSLIAKISKGLKRLEFTTLRPEVFYNIIII